MHWIYTEHNLVGCFYWIHVGFTIMAHFVNFSGIFGIIHVGFTKVAFSVKIS